MEVAEVEPAQDEKTGRPGSSYQDETHPYLTPEFWLNPTNQFWTKSSMYKQEAYVHILDTCRAELKENLIN